MKTVVTRHPNQHCQRDSLDAAEFQTQICHPSNDEYDDEHQVDEDQHRHLQRSSAKHHDKDYQHASEPYGIRRAHDCLHLRRHRYELVRHQDSLADTLRRNLVVLLHESGPFQIYVLHFPRPDRFFEAASERDAHEHHPTWVLGVKSGEATLHRVPLRVGEELCKERVKVFLAHREFDVLLCLCKLPELVDDALPSFHDVDEGRVLQNHAPVMQEALGIGRPNVEVFIHHEVTVLEVRIHVSEQRGRSVRLDAPHEVHVTSALVVGFIAKVKLGRKARRRRGFGRRMRRRRRRGRRRGRWRRRRWRRRR